MPCNDILRAQPAQDFTPRRLNVRELLTTKEVATFTGFSTSFFEKGRLYGYGPDFLKIRGKVLYRKSAVDEWLAAHESTPKGAANAQ